MTVLVTISVNGEKTGWLEITRTSPLHQDTHADTECIYVCGRRDLTEHGVTPGAVAKVRHRYGDGQWELARKALDATAPPVEVMPADHVAFRRGEPVYRIGHGRQWHWAHVAEDDTRLAVCSGQPVYVVGADPVAILPDERCGNHNCRKRWAEWSESTRQKVEREGRR